MANQYKPVTNKFTNKGVVQKLDTDYLVDGQYYSLSNVASIQEGCLQTRYGSSRFGMNSLGSFIHTLEVFKISDSASQQFMYMGEGTDIYRQSMASLDSINPTNMGAVLPDWGKRFTGQKFNAGLSAKPYFFVAASKMLKDKVIEADGSTLTTEFENWGILPPPGALSATVASAKTVDIYTTPDISVSWTDSDDDTWMGTSGAGSAIAISSSAFDLSQFDADTPSGKASDFFDSDDYIELKMKLVNPSRFSQFTLQIDVSTSAGEYLDYYEKAIVPNQLTGVFADTEDPLTAAAARQTYVGSGVLGDTSTSTITPDRDIDSTSLYKQSEYDGATIGGMPTELPPVRVSDTASEQEVTVNIKKKDFLKVRNAGTDGHDWSDAASFRLWAKSATVPAAGITLKVVSLKMVGGGGLNNADAALAPYEWCYTYRNDKTAHESNPSPLMVSDRYIKGIRRQGVALSGFTARSDTQVTSFVIYRRGGAFSGSEFRRVAIIAYDQTTYTDNLSDEDIQYAPIAEFDNDPPVPSKLPTSFKATFSGNSAGSDTVTFTVVQPSGIEAANVIKVGTRLFAQDADKTEEIQVTAISGSDVTAIFQLAHPNTVTVETSTVPNVACRLSAASGSSIYLAGDVNNPDILYKSKSGRPESFPVVTEATELVNQVRVGSASNPIKAITEYGGDILCLNRYNLFVVRNFNGQMQDPMETPAQRGLICDGGWCKADNEVYYLADDGVYAWSGGQSFKKSEQIDWFFKGKTVNGIAPINQTSDYLQYIKMVYFQNEVRLICRDTSGGSICWVYNTIYDRWHPYSPSVESGFLTSSWTTLLSHDNRLFSARNMDADCYLYEEEIGTSYSDNGAGIPFVVQTGFYTLGNPATQKQWGDIILELTSQNSITVKTYYDFSATETDTFTIAGASGRRRVPLPIQSGSAKEAYAVAFRFEGTSTSSQSAALHSITFNVLELTEIQRGRASDWNDYGYPHDKRLDQLIIEYDTGGTSVTLNLDTISGINGNTQNNSVCTFTLSGAGRSKATLPIKVDSSIVMVVAKMVRLRPTATSADFKIYSAEITYENYPPDITYFTDPNDYGSPYDKNFQQLLLDVDTGGVDATVDVYIDNNAAASQSFTVNTTSTNRQYNPVMKTGITGKKARLIITPGASGKFQLFSHNFVTVPADKGAVLHSYDWDNLGTPHDKHLFSMYIEYEVTQDVDMVLEGLSGIGSDQEASTILNFTLTAGTPTTRKIEQIDLPDGSVYKAVRLRAETSYPDINAKIYKYEFRKIDYPPDFTPYTEWSDLGYPCEKVFRTVTVDIDTGGIACSVQVEVDGVNRLTSTVTTTSQNRIRTLSFVSDIADTYVIGKLVRIVLVPETGGKSQLFNYTFEKTLEPCPMTFFDSFEQYFGSNGYKYIKQIWLNYRGGAITVKVYRDSGTLFHTESLPAHTQRDVERFFLPAYYGSVLNKSKSYRITIESTSGDAFYLYRDSSRVESMNLSGDSRAMYNQHYLYSEMPIQK